jgi:hypothetical protein
MIRRATTGLGSIALALALATTQALGQQSIGISADYMGYSFDTGLGADAAQLFLMPVAVRIPIGSRVSFDLYTAWAQGKIERDDTQFTLQGVVDTRIKMTYQLTPWALFSVGASLPTGNATHNGEEAVVSSVLATDLLGFREATWGTGFALTSALATATRVGQWGVGLAAAYSARSEFTPSSEVDLNYQPGNETRIRLGLDRNIGTNTFTLGATYMNYSEDQANSRNLFQAGNRLRFDATYAFRAGAGVWTLYTADLYRQNGDLTLPFVNDAGAQVGDTLITTAKQNLLVTGFVGAISVGGGFVFRPHVDFKVQSRTESDGRDEGSGWMLAAGGDFPIRVFGGYDFFPKARLLIGSIKDPSGTGVGVIGGEFTGTIRWGF